MCAFGNAYTRIFQKTILDTLIYENQKGLTCIQRRLFVTINKYINYVINAYKYEI